MASGTTTTAADTKGTLVSKRRTSVVWNYFAFKTEDAAQRQVLNMLATVATSRDNTTNLF